MAADTTILVVDDYGTMVRIMKGLLRQIGYENVDDAPNGEVALEKIKSGKYDLVISDWNMEPMSGLELLQRVRADEASAQTRFIMVTAESRPENVNVARRAGVDNYLLKPFNAQSLKAKIDQVLAS